MYLPSGEKRGDRKPSEPGTTEVRPLFKLNIRRTLCRVVSSLASGCPNSMESPSGDQVGSVPPSNLSAVAGMYFRRGKRGRSANRPPGLSRYTRFDSRQVTSGGRRPSEGQTSVEALRFRRFCYAIADAGAKSRTSSRHRLWRNSRPPRKFPWGKGKVVASFGRNASVLPDSSYLLGRGLSHQDSKLRSKNAMAQR